MDLLDPDASIITEDYDWPVANSTTLPTEGSLATNLATSILDLFVMIHTTAQPIFAIDNGSYAMLNNSTDDASDVDNDIIIMTSKIVAWFELSFAILGPPMQLLVLFLGTNVYRRTGQTSQLVVLSMTCGDLLVSSIHSPMMFGYFGLSQSYSFFPCALMYLMTYIGCIASSLSLLLLNVDKFIYLSKPLHYHLIVTAKKTGICIAICWVITVSWAVLIIFGPATYFMPQGGCNMSPKHLWVYISFLFVFLSLPTMFSFAISLYIRYLVNRHQHKDEMMQREMSVKSVHESHKESREGEGAGSVLAGAVARLNSSGLSQHRHSRRSHLVASLRSIAFVFSATIWTFCTVLPYRIGYVIHHVKQGGGGTTFFVLVLVLFILLSLNPVGNPIIIIGTQRLYIQFIRKHVGKVCRWKSEYETPTMLTRAETGSVCYSY